MLLPLFFKAKTMKSILLTISWYSILAVLIYFTIDVTIGKEKGDSKLDQEDSISYKFPSAIYRLPVPGDNLLVCNTERLSFSQIEEINSSDIINTVFCLTDQEIVPLNQERMAFGEEILFIQHYIPKDEYNLPGKLKGVSSGIYQYSLENPDQNILIYSYNKKFTRIILAHILHNLSWPEEHIRMYLEWEDCKDGVLDFYLTSVNSDDSNIDQFVIL
jgi:hypothetical protein